MKQIISAFNFFTLIRIGRHTDPKEASYAASVVGLFIGAGLLVIYSFTGGVAPFLMVVWLAVITGFLHLDGLADTFDALLSHRSKEKMLEIMKDSRIGAIGAAALILCFLGKYNAFTHIKEPWLLLVVPAFARFSAVLGGALLPYAGKAGLGKMFSSSLTPLLFIQVVPLVLILLLVSSLNFVALFFFVWFCLIFLLLFWHRQTIGGITGDGLGAMIEISELGLFLLI